MLLAGRNKQPDGSVLDDQLTDRGSDSDQKSSFGRGRAVLWWRSLVDFAVEASLWSGNVFDGDRVAAAWFPAGDEGLVGELSGFRNLFGFESSLKEADRFQITLEVSRVRENIYNLQRAL